MVGPTAIGKGSLAMPAMILWTIGKPMFGIRPAKPLKSLLIRADTVILNRLFGDVRTRVDSLTAFPIFGFTAPAVGVFLAFFARRLPSRGWIGVALLLIAALVWMLFGAGVSSHSSSLPMSMLFLLMAPIAVAYSFQARRPAPGRLPAWAAFVGLFSIDGFFLFMLAGLVYWIYEPFTHAAWIFPRRRPGKAFKFWKGPR